MQPDTSSACALQAGSCEPIRGSWTVTTLRARCSPAATARSVALAGEPGAAQRAVSADKRRLRRAHHCAQRAMLGARRSRQTRPASAVARSDPASADMPDASHGPDRPIGRLHAFAGALGHTRQHLHHAAERPVEGCALRITAAATGRYRCTRLDDRIYRAASADPGASAVAPRVTAGATFRASCPLSGHSSAAARSPPSAPRRPRARAWRPSRIAQTTRLWPRRMSPQAKICGVAGAVVDDVRRRRCRARRARRRPARACPGLRGPRKPIASRIRSAGSMNSLPGTSCIWPPTHSTRTHSRPVTCRSRRSRAWSAPPSRARRLPRGWRRCAASAASSARSAPCPPSRAAWA